ncbi:MAG: Cof-type HAD-IIB family hydrolase [Tissierellia bacterium]|nr:Cof-type HAD-IIB family hydrolase [Tissierellia bacterium]
MVYNTVVMDMDGTLLDDKKHITANTLEVLNRLQKKGVNIVIATGRLWESPNQYAKYYNLFSHTIAANGTIITDNKGNLVDEGSLSSKSLLSLLKIVREYGAGYYFVGDKIIYTSNLKADVGAFYQPIGLEHCFPRIAEAEANSIGVDSAEPMGIRKFLLYHRDDTVLEKIKNEINTLEDVEISSSFRQNVEITPKGFHKGWALKRLMDHINVNIRETVAFGDYLNDKTLLETAGMAVVMENGHPKLKEIATRIAPANNEDGVAVVLNQMEAEGLL